MCADVPNDVSESIEQLRDTLETALSKQLTTTVELGDCHARCSGSGVVVAAEVHLPEVEDALNNAFGGEVEASPIEVELGDAP